MRSAIRRTNLPSASGQPPIPDKGRNVFRARQSGSRLDAPKISVAQEIVGSKEIKRKWLTLFLTFRLLSIIAPALSACFLDAFLGLRTAFAFAVRAGALPPTGRARGG